MEECARVVACQGAQGKLFGLNQRRFHKSFILGAKSSDAGSAFAGTARFGVEASGLRLAKLEAKVCASATLAPARSQTDPRRVT